MLPLHTNSHLNSKCLTGDFILWGVVHLESNSYVILWYYVKPHHLNASTMRKNEFIYLYIYISNKQSFDCPTNMRLLLD